MLKQPVWFPGPRSCPCDPAFLPALKQRNPRRATEYAGRPDGWNTRRPRRTIRPRREMRAGIPPAGNTGGASSPGRPNTKRTGGKEAGQAMQRSIPDFVRVDRVSCVLFFPVTFRNGKKDGGYPAWHGLFLNRNLTSAKGVAVPLLMISLN